MANIQCGQLLLTVQGGMLQAQLNGMQLIPEPAPLYVLRDEAGNGFSSADFGEEKDCTQFPDGMLLSVTSHPDIYDVRVDFCRTERGIAVSYTVRARWPEGIPGNTSVSFPWLPALALPEAAERFPSAPVSKSCGASGMQLKGFCFPPYCLERGDGTGLAVYFPVAAANLTWDVCKNAELGKISSRKMLENHNLKLRLSQAPAVIADMQLWPLSGGWTECFQRFRKEVRRDVDFTQYHRKDLQWIRDCTLTHFTYAFGKEFFDYDSRKADLTRLFKQGEEFGGYDTIILWHEYPRLGVDARTQWNLFEEYPGGIQYLKDLIAQAHDRGVKVIIPFKPWDRSPEENDLQTTQRIANLMRELDADGIFFDTMNTVPAAFRAAIDAQRQGVVFMVESEPCEQHAIESITCSWNQYHTEPSMPEANLLRFLFPEQTRFAIARWHTGKLKDMAIERAVFNGEGMVIWQDVFGCWIPYSETQKKKILEWKRLLGDYRDVFQSPDAIPLIRTEQSGLYANLFRQGDRAIMTLYNDGDAPVEGALIPAHGYPFVEALRAAEDLHVVEGMICGKVCPGATAVLLLHH